MANTFKSVLSQIGHGFLEALKFLGSSGGQKVTQAVETAAVVVADAEGGPTAGAIVTGVNTLFNNAIVSVVHMEASASAVAAQSGTGLQKAAGVIATLTPQVETFLTDIVGIKQPTEDQINKVANTLSQSVVDVFNSIPASPTAPPVSGAPVLPIQTQQ